MKVLAAGGQTKKTQKFLEFQLNRVLSWTVDERQSSVQISLCAQYIFIWSRTKEATPIHWPSFEK